MASVLIVASLATGLFSLGSKLPEFLLREGSNEDKPACLPLCSPTMDQQLTTTIPISIKPSIITKAKRPKVTLPFGIAELGPASIP
ncbi:hypothetical protein HanIR_Chr06g0279811 [Helianthus annuus]|nr:hypothetical protein HanIR_Chr06g0279811 [Helianthus annuus]